MSDYLLNLINKAESKTLDFKRDLSSPDNVMKTLVAFSNTAGGKIIIGVDDDKKVIGIEDPFATEEKICSMIADSIVPRLVPNIEMATINNKTILIVETFLSNTRPHYLKPKGLDKGVYVRIGSSNRQADPQLIAELKRTAEGITFDEMPLPELAVDDLDLKVVRELFEQKQPIGEKELLTLKVLTRHQKKNVPTKGGFLLFGKNRDSYFPDAWLQCGRFIGKDKADIFDHIDINEPLPKSVDSVMLFLKKHAIRGADFSEIRRKDVWNIPLGIMREVVINALVHADYSQRGAPFRISFFDDRIEVENPGILLPGMTIEDMKQGISKVRNPVIARAFRELNLIEQWGSGVPRIFKEAKEAGLPEPQIKEIGTRLRFIVFLKVPLLIQTESKKDKKRPEIQPGLRPELRIELILESKLAAKVLMLLKEVEASKSQLAEYLGHKSVSGELKKQIKRLLNDDIIEMTIPDIPQSRNQKYRLTKKGKALMENSIKKQ